MLRKITEIYTEYNIPPNLQRHMLWVAAVASKICDNFTEPVLKEDIVTACLLHDMGNIIKYEMGRLPELLEPEGVEYWKKVQDEYIKKYGESEHKATLQIMKELGVASHIIQYVNQIGFSNYCANVASDDFSLKIVNYADGRVDPYGIVSYDERMEEGGKRYKNRADNDVKEEQRQKLVDCGKEIEKQIFAKCKIKPEDINDESVKDIVLSLKDFVIK